MNNRRLSVGSGALLFAIFGAFVSSAPQARAAENMLLIFCDVAGCTGGDSVELFSDGTTITPFTSGTETIKSQSTGNDPFNLQLTASIGVFSVVGDLGQLNPTADEAMDLSYSVTSSTAGTLYMYFGGSGFTGGPFSGEVDGNSSGAISSVTYTACYENNAGSSTDGTMGPCGSGVTTNIGSETFTTTPYSGSFSSSVLITASPFGLLQQIEVVTAGNASTSGDAQLLPVPEPTSVLLLGTVLALTGFYLRRYLSV